MRFFFVDLNWKKWVWRTNETKKAQKVKEKKTKKKRQPFKPHMGACENYSITLESGLWEVQHLMNQGPFVRS